MPHYKSPQNELFWMDSVEEESFLPPNCVRITDEEASVLRAAKQAEYAEALTYAERRAGEYPSFADQFDLLYHGGYDAWKAAIQEVKDKYPKG
jgi:hypothetical protein